MATAMDLMGPWFRTLASSVPTGVVLLDSEGVPVYSNAAAGKLLGLPSSDGPDEARRRLEEVLPPDLCAARSPGSEIVELELPPPTGVRQILLQTVPLEVDGGGTLLLIEDRMRMAALESSLLLSRRLQAESMLRAQVHDLKAPLNALALNVQLLRESLEEEEHEPAAVREQQVATTDILEREIKRLGRSLDVFLRRATRSFRVRSRLRRLEVRRPVRETARLIRNMAKSSGVGLRTLLPKTSTYVLANSDLLREALLNVALNALEAQGEGGEIRLRVEPVGAEVRLVVEDDGPGIPEDLQEKVFEIDFTTKEGGTGIGLTVARSLIRAQGGRLNLSSRVGEGTTIEIFLPGAPTRRTT